MSEAAVKGLTLTWDVLKPEHGNDAELQLLINFNMGCIETIRTYGIIVDKL